MEKLENLPVQKLEQLFQEGNKCAALMLGFYYQQGIDVKQNYNSAVKYYEIAAENQDRIAILNLGYLFDVGGHGLKANKLKAIHYYQEAADMEDPIAQLNLAYLYESRGDLAQNIDTAIYWFTKAAENGEQEAQYWLAHMFENGIGVDKDIYTALIWYRKAAAQGDRDATECVSFIEENYGTKAPYQNRNAEAPIKRVEWEILPPGEHSAEIILAHLTKNSNRIDKRIKICKERITKLSSLNPDSIYYGVVGVEGYLVFYFRKKQIAILDCPLYGNAIYVVKGDWKKLSKFSKIELRENSRSIRFIHKGEWFDRLKKTFKDN